MKKLIAVLTAMGLMLVLVSAVGAQEATPSTDSNGDGRGGNRPLRELVNIIAEETGLTPREIARQVRDGSTLAEIITANDGDVQDVIDRAVSTITQHVNQAVTEGKITQERADDILANLTEKVTQAINGEMRPNRGSERRVGMALLRLAAEQTGLTARDIVQEIRSGKSLADVLTEHGVDTEAFITSAVLAVDQRLDQAVTNGRLTQAEADQKMAQFEETLRERITQPGGMQTPAATTTST